MQCRHKTRLTAPDGVPVSGERGRVVFLQGPGGEGCEVDTEGARSSPGGPLHHSVPPGPAYPLPLPSAKLLPFQTMYTTHSDLQVNKRHIEASLVTLLLAETFKVSTIRARRMRAGTSETITPPHESRVPRFAPCFLFFPLSTSMNCVSLCPAWIAR